MQPSQSSSRSPPAHDILSIFSTRPRVHRPRSLRVSRKHHAPPSSSTTPYPKHPHRASPYHLNHKPAQTHVTKKTKQPNKQHTKPHHTTNRQCGSNCSTSSPSSRSPSSSYWARCLSSCWLARVGMGGRRRDVIRWLW
ncbi:uncharacterized protein K452DRAFT_30271 [Aplosporella prunicola CBS 121167]|uniref:Uncharacterized protein n=1 Tax=Aplosporella prunicola CBS 121167 TaxID=1176127 RepID=A0A6A6BBF1_9PEZI|nr:uncharacterized protein K452DRAFT_30271 [Aplosporella prunicola CBS 121167]KAF2141562.1 hypothetical protein K452DRAFT_30271 [Aplosporella prunicola CBS 121167]